MQTPTHLPSVSAAYLCRSYRFVPVLWCFWGLNVFLSRKKFWDWREGGKCGHTRGARHKQSVSAQGFKRNGFGNHVCANGCAFPIQISRTAQKTSNLQPVACGSHYRRRHTWVGVKKSDGRTPTPLTKKTKNAGQLSQPSHHHLESRRCTFNLEMVRGCLCANSAHCDGSHRGGSALP